MFGGGFASTMIALTDNPFSGLLIGIFATSLIQSSSTTTSIVVGLVAGGALTLPNAIPIVMGANIGTTITNTLVSMGHITNKVEFKRAFSASVVHDFFNICAVLVLFPLEYYFHIIQKTSELIGSWFTGIGGMKLFNPLKLILNPVINLIDSLLVYIPFSNVFLLLFAGVLLFGSLTYLIKTIRSLVLNKLELFINNYLFRNDLFGFAFGIIMTAIVQSSSITTSLIIPLAGAGLITVRQIFPYTMGANIGTTITAMLAALATQNQIAVMVAFSHLTFNIFGIIIFYPLKNIPIKLAEFVGEKAAISTKNLVIFIGIYLCIYFVPIIFIIWL
jgi:sodium-dependent phosphate cotransporter